MNFVSVFMAIFSVIGAFDLIFGNRLGLGREFEKGFLLFGNLALSMIGMIVLSPLLGELMQPVSNWIHSLSGIDPSILPAIFFSSDMGGAALADTMGRTEELKLFNGLVVASMMGCTISFTIPVALGIVKPEQHKLVLSGFLCGIITIPVGCFVSGIIQGINIFILIRDLMPMIIFSALISIGLAYFPGVCIKIFAVVGNILKILITVGLMLGIIKFLTGIEVVKGLDTLEEGGKICLSASVIMSGAFPFLRIVSKIIEKPLGFLGKKLGINRVSTFGFFSSLATSITTFNSMKDMDEKGVMLNAAFAISAAFIFAGQLAFTLSFNAGYVWYVITAKLISGVSALIIANITYGRLYKK